MRGKSCEEMEKAIRDNKRTDLDHLKEHVNSRHPYAAGLFTISLIEDLQRRVQALENPETT